MPKVIIHVHVQRLKQGLPAIIVRRGGRSEHYSTVEVFGPSVVVSDPSRTRSPRTWIETYSQVVGRP